MTRRDRRKHEEAGWLSRLENNCRKEENRESGGGGDRRDKRMLDPLCDDEA